MWLRPARARVSGAITMRLGSGRAPKVRGSKSVGIPSKGGAGVRCGPDKSALQDPHIVASLVAMMGVGVECAQERSR